MPIYKHLFQRIQENKFSFGIYLKNVCINTSIIQTVKIVVKSSVVVPPASGGQCYWEPSIHVAKHNFSHREMNVSYCQTRELRVQSHCLILSVCCSWSSEQSKFLAFHLACANGTQRFSRASMTTFFFYSSSHSRSPWIPISLPSMTHYFPKSSSTFCCQLSGARGHLYIPFSSPTKSVRPAEHWAQSRHTVKTALDRVDKHWTRARGLPTQPCHLLSVCPWASHFPHPRPQSPHLYNKESGPHDSEGPSGVEAPGLRDWFISTPQSQAFCQQINTG